MSEATECNYCTLQRMRKTAKDMGVAIVIARVAMGDST